MRVEEEVIDHLRRMTTAQIYQTYSPGDKEALKELRQEAAKKLGRDISLAEAISAVEPSLVTPVDLAKV